MPGFAHLLSLPAARHLFGGLAFAAWTIQAFSSHQTGQPTLRHYFLVQLAGWTALGLLALGPAWESRTATRSVLAWAVAFRLVAATTTPILENDWARHLWDGWRLWTTGNPYDQPPAAFYRDPGVPEALQPVLNELNYADVPTVYGPVLQGWCGLAAGVQAGALWPFKLLLVAADLGVLALIHSLYGRRAAGLYGWCPLVIHEVAANAHADILGVLPLLFALRAARNGNFTQTGIGLGLAIATKLSALVAVPFVLPLCHPDGRFRSRDLAVSGLACLGTVGAAYLPFWAQGSTADLAGLRQFASAWEFNPGLPGWLSLWMEPGAARLLSGMVAVTALAAWRWRTRRQVPGHPRLDLVFGLQWATSAVVNPWYLVWVAPFVAARPTWTGWAALIGVGLSYCTALNLGLPGTEPFQLPTWVRPAEHLLLGVGCLADLWRIKRSAARAAVPRTSP
jgi:alpha-1,6-mannosyltransferase